MVYQAGVGRGPSLWPARARLREAAPTAALFAALLAAGLSGPGGLSAGGVYVGAGLGAGLGLQTLGVVLVFRASRVVNFAQLQLGLVGAALFAVIVQRQELLVWLAAGCPACLPGGSGSAPAWLTGLELVLALGAALAVGAGLGWAAHALVLRRLEGSPRLAATVATVGIALLCSWLEAQLPGWFVTRDRFGQVVGSSVASGPTAAPFGLPAGALTMAAAALAALGLPALLGLTRTGLGLRGAAENGERARTLGLDAARLQGLAWLLAGVLSAAGGLLEAMAGHLDTSAPFSVVPLAGVLAAALLARLDSLVLGATAALLLGLVQAASLRWFGTADAYEGALVAVIAAALLIPRRRGFRGQDAEAGGWVGAREPLPVAPHLRATAAFAAARRWLLGALVLAAVGAPWLLSPAQDELASFAALNALLGLSVLVLSGWAGQVSLGQLALAAAGAYAAALLGGAYGVPFPVCLVAGALAGGAGAAVFGLPALRVQGLHLAVLTLALATAAPALLLNPSYLGAPLQDQVLDRPVLLGLDLGDERAFLLLCLALLALAYLGLRALRRTAPGRALAAARENEGAARALGVDVVRLRWGAFVLSGCIAGLAGALLAYLQRGVPALTYGPDAGLQLFLMTVIGGLGSPAGPLLGALYFALAGALPGALPGFLLGGAGVLAVVLVAPGGIVQVLAGLRDSWLRRLEGERRAPAPLLPARGGPPPRYRLDQPGEASLG